VLAKVIDVTMGLRVTPDQEAEGLDLSQHSETGWSFGELGSMGRIG
jgi:Amt family ammonium transporter